MKEDINKKTVDDSWASMKALLDQEMPVDTQRRRFVWWWFLLLLMPLVALGGWYFVSGTSTADVPAKQELSPAAIPFAVEKSSNTATNSNTSKDTNLTSKAQTSELPTPSNRNQQDAPASKPILKATLMGMQPAEKALPGITAIPADGIGPQLEFQPHTLMAFTDSLGNAAASTTLFKQETLHSLPLSMQYVQSQYSNVVPAPLTIGTVQNEIVIDPVVKKGTWAFGLGATFGTERFKAVNSMGGGTAVHWQPTRRWGVRSGLYYVKYSVSATAQPATVVNFNQYSDILNDEFEITDLAGNTISFPTYIDQSDAVVIPVSSVAMIEMPVLVSLQLPGRWKMFAGITGNYILNANSKKEGYTANSFRLKANTDPAIESLDDFVTSSINRWGVDVQSGTSCRLGKNWELGLFAKLPIRRLNDGDAPVSGGTSLSPPSSGMNLKDRLPLTFLIQANYYLISR